MSILIPIVLVTACTSDQAAPSTSVAPPIAAVVSTTIVSSPSSTDATTTTTQDPSTLVGQLFADDLPPRVVVALTDSLEIWEGGGNESISHPMSHRFLQIEGDLAVVAITDRPQDAVVDLHNPDVVYPIECPRLMTRGDEILALSQCWSDQWSLVEVVSGEERETPIPWQSRQDGEYVWFAERGGTAVAGIGDAEGNLTQLTTTEGTDLLGNGYAGLTVLSTDGRHLAYVDHADSAALSHFWSPVVVVVDTETGEEVRRWTLDNPVLCLEFAETWVVACEVDDFMSLEPSQQALVAMDITTGEVNRVETSTRVFLPS